MSMSKRYLRGFTLIEVIIFIVVVAAGLAGILTVSNTVVKSSADPMVHKQAVAIAESLLEEILLKAYCDPSTVDNTTVPPACGVQGAHTLGTDADRKPYDKVMDYNTYKTTNGVLDYSTNTPTPSLARYNITPAVVVDCVVNVGDSAGAPCTDSTFRRIVVSVTDPQNNVIRLTGYRGNY
jgi:MSHA pilin protein MshD